MKNYPTYIVTFQIFDRQLGEWLQACRKFKAKNEDFARKQCTNRFRQTWSGHKRQVDAGILSVEKV